MTRLIDAKVIDAWAQPALRTGVGVPEADRLLRRSGQTALLDGDVPPARLVELMDAAGVDHLVLSAWSRPEGNVFSNDDVAVFTSAYPERFSGAAAVGLNDPVGAVRELRRAVTELGFRALRVIPWLWELPPDDRRYYPLYVACVELGVPFCTQIGQTGPDKPSEPGRPIPYLERVLLDFPELVVVGGHIGEPWLDEALFLAWKFDGFHIDTSAHPPSRYPRKLLEFMRAGGGDRVLFGSNWPHLRLDVARQAAALDLPADVLAAFLGGNAARVFGLAAQTS